MPFFGVFLPWCPVISSFLFIFRPLYYSQKMTSSCGDWVPLKTAHWKHSCTFFINYHNKHLCHFCKNGFYMALRNMSTVSLLRQLPSEYVMMTFTPLLCFPSFSKNVFSRTKANAQNMMRYVMNNLGSTSTDAHCFSGPKISLVTAT